MPAKTKIIIPRNHRRSLSVTARQIENSIIDIEELILKKVKNKLTERFIVNLEDETKKSIIDELSLLRTQNQKMFEELGLEPFTSYEDRIIKSKITHLWTLLCDSSSAGLKGFGKLTKEQAERIDVHINELLDTVNKIQKLIEE